MDGKICTTPREKVRGGESIEIDAIIEVKENWSAQPIQLDIVCEDNDLIIVNKPAGLVTHPGAGNHDNTLVNALLHYDPQLNTIPRAGLIHRLDKDTSGLLVIAKNLETHHALVQAMQQRDIKREYSAIVTGVMISGATIEAPIGRHPTHRTKMSVIPSGKPAITHYRIIKKYRAHTHLRVILETGRTHQIRVHLAHVNYPIVGDPTYGNKRALPGKISEHLRTTLRQFKRQALHAQKLELIHPKTQTTLQWEVPPPADMQNLLLALAEDEKTDAE